VSKCEQVVDKSFVTNGAKGVELCGRYAMFKTPEGAPICGACDYSING